MSEKKLINILFWIAFSLYSISLILPYRIQTNSNVTISASVTPITPVEYESGIEHGIPLFSLIGIVLLIVLIYVKHTNFTRWSALFISILLTFPVLPFYLLTVSFCIYCSARPGIGFYLHCIASVLFLTAMISKFRMPYNRKKNDSLMDILDDF